MKRKKPTISDREIQRQLAGLREIVAAPRDFRSRILSQLAAETGQAAPASGSTLWRRLMDLAARPALLPVLAASAALGFGIWFAASPAPQVQETAVAQEVQAKANPAPQAKLQVAKARPKAASSQSVALPSSSALQNEAPSGNAVPAAAQTQTSFSALHADGVSAAGLPTAGPGADPAPKKEGGLSGSSQVRRNRFLASRGEYAAILVKIKAPGRIRVECFDRTGKLIGVLHDADEAAGTFEVRWHGHDQNGQLAPTGIYAVRISTPEYHDTHKVVLVR